MRPKAWWKLARIALGVRESSIFDLPRTMRGFRFSLDAMWAEGPGGGNYDNMVGNSTHTACGFYTTPQGKVWMIQDFWTE